MRHAAASAAMLCTLLGSTALAQTRPTGREAAQAPAADPLRDGFRDPPADARPRVWWHWMNGNVTKDGIARDLDWMKRVGIGGVQTFDVAMMTPTIVARRLGYMTPEWKDAFRFAATRADALGLEMAIAASPGWSETGGPWVQPEDGLKKLVWSETILSGGRRFTGRLPSPPTVTGPFQTLRMPPSFEDMMAGRADASSGPERYADVAVLAYPAAVAAPSKAVVTLGDGRRVPDDALDDDAPETAIDVAAGTAATPAVVMLTYDAPRTVRSATLFFPGAKGMFQPASIRPRLEASDDGVAWRTVVDDIAVTPVPTTVGFRGVTARRFRLVLAPAAGTGSNMGDPAPGIAVSSFAGVGGGGPPSIRVGMFRLSGEARIDQFETKAGFSIARDYYALRTDAPPGEAGVDPSRVVDLTARMRSDGTLDWTPPPGSWRVVRLGHSLLGTTNHPASPEATGLEVDKFDGAAVRRYLDHYLGLYRGAAGADMFGARGVRALLTDSIEVGASNWTPQMLAQFRRLRGYDPLPWLPALTGTVVGTRAQSDGFLYDYRRTLADLIASEHYGTIARVAHDNGLKVYGEALEDNRPSLGDDMAMRAYADVPMAAMWTFGRAAGPRATYVADIKGAASVAHLYGQNLVAAESMTSALAPWASAPADLRRVIDMEFVSGVNRPVIHTSVHQPVDDKVPGLALAIFGQYFNRHETWAEMAKPWIDYMARSGFLLQQGRNVADVAYFYGEEAPLTGLYGERAVPDAPVRYAYDFVDPAVVNDLLSVDRGDLVAGSGARYRLLYLGGSSRRMTLAMLRRIATLVEAGATVVGDAPTAAPGLIEDAAAYRALVDRLWSRRPVTIVGRGRVIAGTDVEAALATIGATPDFSYARPQPDSEILFIHRTSDAGQIYFLSNRRDRAQTIEARFRVTGRLPELWHADTGRTERLSYRTEGDTTVVPLDLDAEESVFVVFRRAALVPAATIAKPVATVMATLDGPWQVAFQPGRGAPAATGLARLASLSEHADPGIRYFSGVATYTHGLTLPRGAGRGMPLLLDLGRVGDIAEVRVNGTPVGTLWHAPYRIDIGVAVKPGHNRLEVRVANLWVNRLIGDAQPGARKITWTAMPTYSPDAPLRPAGLIGPVTISASPRAAALKGQDTLM